MRRLAALANKSDDDGSDTEASSPIQSLTEAPQAQSEAPSKGKKKSGKPGKSSGKKKLSGRPQARASPRIAAQKQTDQQQQQSPSSAASNQKKSWPSA